MKKFIILTTIISFALAQTIKHESQALLDSYSDDKNRVTPNNKILRLRKGLQMSGCSITYSSRGINKGCSICSSGWYKVRSNYDYNYFFCKLCQSGCQKCSNENGFIKCSSCYSQYFLQNNKCYPCTNVASNCNKCSWSTCYHCKSKYFLEGNQCKNCIPHCDTCLDGISCKSCEMMYEYDHSLKICKELPLWKRILIYVAIGFTLMIIACVCCCICICGTVEQTINGRSYKTSRWNRWRGNSTFQDPYENGFLSYDNGVGDEHYIAPEYYTYG